MRIFDFLENVLGQGRVKENFILAPFTTFKMGGPAEYYFEAQTDEDIINAVKAAHDLEIPLTILGGASNVVISDKGIKGLVLRNQVMYKKILEQDKSSTLLQVSSGYSITRLAKETADEGLSGLEYHLGLPGTVGGSLYMNSKWYINPGKDRQEAFVGDPLIKAQLVLLDGKTKVVDRDYFEFAYDHSILQKTREIIVWAQFKLAKTNPQITIATAKESREYRHQTQPFGVATSGCFFRNINGQSAGKIIDELGLKGQTIGGIQVSDKHANFLINKGNGTMKDVFELVTLIKERAKNKYGVKLEEEIIII
jgi:UDP-N-acetylmuramate dehydrogenase